MSPDIPCTFPVITIDPDVPNTWPPTGVEIRVADGDGERRVITLADDVNTRDAMYHYSVVRRSMVAWQMLPEWEENGG